MVADLISTGKRKMSFIYSEATTGYSFCNPLYSSTGNSRSLEFRNVLKRKSVSILADVSLNSHF